MPQRDLRAGESRSGAWRVKAPCHRSLGYRAPVFLALVCTLAFFPACSEGTTSPGTMCTQEARASVMVSVTDGAGLPLGGATVSWRVDGGPEGTAECADPLASSAACTRFVAGWEVVGGLIIHAAKPGFVAVEAAVAVSMDAAGCHVVTEAVTLALPSATAAP